MGLPLAMQNKSLTTFEIYRALRREMHIVRVKSWPSATEVVSGTGATSVQEDAVTVSTGTTHASTAGRYLPVRLPGTVENYSIQWGKKFYIAFSMWILEGSTLVNGEDILRILLTQSTSITNLAAHGLGIKTNGANINLVSYGTGGSETIASAATNLAHKDRVAIHIEHDPASADRLYINGVLKATQSTAANIPSTEPAADYNLFVSWARSGGTAIGNNSLVVENVEYGLKF